MLRKTRSSELLVNELLLVLRHSFVKADVGVGSAKRQKGDIMLNQFLVGIFALIFINNPALAQGANCGDHTAIVAQLTQQYGETRQNMGMNGNHSIVEVFASDATGTWTILLTMPTGQSCLMAAGQNWEVVAGEVEPNGDPT